MISSKIGAKIKEMRLEKKMSQDQLAEKADISKSSLSYIENGTNSPSLKTFEAICNALEISPSDLFADDPTEAAKNTIREAISDDKELLEFWTILEQREDLQLLFRQTKSLSPSTIRRVIKYIKMVEDEEAQADL